MFKAPRRGTASQADIRGCATPLGYPVRRIHIFGGFHAKSMLRRQLADAAEPLAFTRIVRMRKEKGNVDPLREELTQAAHADFAIGKDHRARHAQVSGPAR